MGRLVYYSQTLISLNKTGSLVFADPNMIKHLKRYNYIYVIYI